jgi:AcrR family transcriptional regulator
MTPRGEARAQAILEAAGEMFVRRGYDAVSLDEVIAAAGGTKSNISTFFGGKEGLFVAAMNHRMGMARRPLDALPLDRLSLREGLLALGQAMAGVIVTQESMEFRRRVSAEAKRFPELGRRWFEQGPEQAIRIVAKFLERHRGEGTIRAGGDMLLAARLFTGMLTQRSLLQTLYTPDDLSPEDEVSALIGAAVDIFVAHLSAVQPKG